MRKQHPQNAVFPIVAMFRLSGWIQVAKELQQLQSAFNVNVMSNTDVFCVFPISTSKVVSPEFWDMVWIYPPAGNSGK